MTDLFSYEHAATERDTGMHRAADRAERADDGWNERAYQWIKQYAASARGEFVSEDCTEAAIAAGIPAPPDQRAWGAPFKRAARDGVIKRVGFGISRRRHLSPTPLWVSAR